MMESNEMYFHPNKGWEASEFVPAQGACCDHRNRLSSNFASSLLDLISYLGQRTPQLCRILPLCHMPQCSASLSQCQGAAHSPAAASSPVLQQLPEAGIAGQLLATNRKGFCKFAIIWWKNWGLPQGQILKLPSTGANPTLSVSVAVSGTGLFFPLTSNEGNHPKAVHPRAVLRRCFLFHYPKNGSFWVCVHMISIL